MSNLVTEALYKRLEAAIWKCTIPYEYVEMPDLGSKAFNKRIEAANPSSGTTRNFWLGNYPLVEAITNCGTLCVL